MRTAPTSEASGRCSNDGHKKQGDCNGVTFLLHITAHRSCVFVPVCSMPHRVRPGTEHCCSREKRTRSTCSCLRAVPSQSKRGFRRQLVFARGSEGYTERRHGPALNITQPETKETSEEAPQKSHGRQGTVRIRAGSTALPAGAIRCGYREELALDISRDSAVFRSSRRPPVQGHCPPPLGSSNCDP